jgi:hypothetical protein
MSLTREIMRRSNLMSVLIFVLLAPMAVVYLLITAVDILLTKFLEALWH